MDMIWAQRNLDIRTGVLVTASVQSALRSAVDIGGYDYNDNEVCIRQF